MGKDSLEGRVHVSQALQFHIADAFASEGYLTLARPNGLPVATALTRRIPVSAKTECMLIEPLSEERIVAQAYSCSYGDLADYAQSQGISPKHLQRDLDAFARQFALCHVSACERMLWAVDVHYEKHLAPMSAVATRLAKDAPIYLRIRLCSKKE